MMINPKILIAIFFSLFIASAIYGLKISIITDRKRLKLVREAMEKNHMLKGKLVKSKIVQRRNPTRPQDINMRRSFDLGIYEYEYKGKTYKTKILAQLGHLQKDLDLFYVKNPKKATSEYSLGKTEISWLKHFIITFIIFYILYVGI